MDNKVSIPRNLAKRLERVTRKAGVTPGVLVRTALANQLDYEEWFLKAVDEGIADLDAGRVFTTRQVLAALGKQRAQHFARKPGAWSALPKAKAGWDTPATNAAIADALTGGKLP